MDIVGAVRAALRGRAGINLHSFPLALEFCDGVLTIEGEVADIATKKLALEAAVAVPGVTGIVDRIRVVPAQRMSDAGIRDQLRIAMLQESAFADFTIRERTNGSTETLHEAANGKGVIEFEVDDGVVVLNGRVPGLGHKRLAGVLAWWVPGSRDVINGLEDVPEEEDSDAEITDAVRLVLEKDVFVNAGQIRVSTRERVVTLEGLVPKEAEREMAERDAWLVFGVDRVMNRLAVRP